jgi:hypothetical protein
MAVSGNWVLHFSWGCTGSYGQANILFNTNGTFSIGGSSGQWRQRDGTILLSFASGPAKYGGTVNGNVGSGAMSTFAGLDGCWYLTRQGITGVVPQATAEAEQEFDVSGNVGGAEARTGQGAFDAAGNPA